MTFSQFRRYTEHVFASQKRVISLSTYADAQECSLLAFCDQIGDWVALQWEGRPVLRKNGERLAGGLDAIYDFEENIGAAFFDAIVLELLVPEEAAEKAAEPLHTTTTTRDHL